MVRLRWISSSIGKDVFRLRCLGMLAAYGVTLEEARANLEEAVTMVLEANRELSPQSLEGAEVIRETLILPAA